MKTQIEQFKNGCLERIEATNEEVNKMEEYTDKSYREMNSRVVQIETNITSKESTVCVTWR